MKKKVRKTKTRVTQLRPKSAVGKALLRVRRRILKGWTRWVLAQDRYGCSVEPTDKTATCWCLIGAIDSELVSGPLRADVIGNVGRTISDMRAKMGLLNISIVAWNDDYARDKRDVVRLIDRTIKRVEENEKKLVGP